MKFKQQPDTKLENSDFKITGIAVLGDETDLSFVENTLVTSGKDIDEINLNSTHELSLDFMNKDNQNVLIIPNGGENLDLLHNIENFYNENRDTLKSKKIIFISYTETNVNDWEGGIKKLMEENKNIYLINANKLEETLKKIEF